MHCCFEVFEIRDLIFHHVYYDSSLGVNVRDTLALALTCHTFEDHALDILWHTQTDFVRLIKTLPRRYWFESGNSKFSLNFELRLGLALSNDDFARFRSYTRRIRHIAYLPYAWHRDANPPQDQKALRSIWSYHKTGQRPLFPNLQHLEFIEAKHAVHCLDIFLLTKSISLSLFWSVSTSERLYCSISRIIGDHALNMEELDLGSSQAGSAKTTAPSLSPLVCKMSDLRGLATGTQLLDLPALRHLASLTRLRKLQSPNAAKDILESIQNMRSAPFSELQQLTLRETDFSSLTQLIIRLNPLKLQDLTLFAKPIPTAGDIHAAFSALKKSNQLTSLHRVVLKHRLNADLARSFEFKEDIIVDESIIQPLLSFRNLTEVVLDLPCTFDMGDEAVKAMAEAWPRLRRLQLGALAGWHFPPSVTFIGLLVLLRKCRELEYLVLPLNGSREFIPPLSSLTAADVNEKITYLYVGNGKMTFADAHDVSQFLLHIFPRLCGIGGGWLCREGNPYQREWEQVVGYMKRDPIQI